MTAAAVVIVLVLGVVTGVAAATVAQRMLAVEGLAVPAVDHRPTEPQRLPTEQEPEIRRVLKLADHPILAAGVTLPEVTCELPRFRRDVASLRQYYGSLVDCLDTAWHPVLSAGKMPAGRPMLNLAEHPGETGCGNPDEDGEGEFTALYCPADETLYLPVDRLKEVDGGSASSHLAIVAHEYAHHVQEQSGMLLASAEEIDDAGAGTPAGQELSRRIELQANCFAGLFLAAAAGQGSISRNLADQAVGDFRHGGLHDTHGNKANQAEWARRGYRQGTLAACNTWAAPADEVS